MIIAMSKVRLLGPRERQSEVLRVLQDLNVLHLASPGTLEGRPMPLARANLARREHRERQQLLRVVADLDAAMRDLDLPMAAPSPLATRATLVEIARTVHLSPFHFHRRFTELLGVTPKHFMLDCQIQQAKGELLARQKELARFAKECGFAHQSHFTSRFKQATGLTPTRWRRMATETQRA